MTLRSTTINVGQQKELGNLKIQYLGAIGTSRANTILMPESGAKTPWSFALNAPTRVQLGNYVYFITLNQISNIGNVPYAKFTVDDGKTHPAYGVIRFESVPTKAEIYIDNVRYGLKTNCTATRIPLGYHSFKMILNGYKTYSSAAELTAAHTAHAPLGVGHHFVPLTDPYGNKIGNINCTSTPAGANIYLNGKLQNAKTPTVLKNVPTGNYRIEFKLSGYNSVILQQVRVPSSGETINTVAKFVKQNLPDSLKAKLVITSSPRGAELILDGKRLGVKTPTTITTTEGVHAISFTKYGYHDMSKSVYAKNNRRTSVFAMLLESNKKGFIEHGTKTTIHKK